MKLLEECSIDYMSKSTKIFVNGNWIGCTHSPLKIITIMKLHRRNNMIDIYTSIHFNIKNNEIIICSDAGRPIRPLFYIMDGELSYQRENVAAKYDNDIFGLKLPEVLIIIKKKIVVISLLQSK